MIVSEFLRFRTAFGCRSVAGGDGFQIISHDFHFANQVSQVVIVRNLELVRFTDIENAFTEREDIPRVDVVFDDGSCHFREMRDLTDFA